MGRIDRVAYSEFEDIGDAGWDPVRAMIFEPYPVDSIVSGRRFDVVVCLRYSAHATLPETTLLAEESALSEPFFTSPDSTSVKFRLLDADGQPTGRGGLVTREVCDTLRRDFALPPGYTVTLTMPGETAAGQGLLNAGVLLIRTE